MSATLLTPNTTPQTLDCIESFSFLSPVGILVVSLSPTAVHSVDWASDDVSSPSYALTPERFRGDVPACTPPTHDHLPKTYQDLSQQTLAAFQAYFNHGQDDGFTTLPLAPFAGPHPSTDFQRAVWQGLQAIPAGTTWTYGQLAKHIGRPEAVRAVGQANRRNPLPIIIPCHRVIGQSGELTGYQGTQGLHRKAWLLDHEGAKQRQ